MIKTANELIAAAQSQIDCVDAAAAKALYEQAEEGVIIDVREADAAAESKLKAAVNIPRGVLELKLPALCATPETLILIHCGGGGRASLSALTLQQMGYVNVHAITARYEDIKAVFDGEKPE